MSLIDHVLNERPEWVKSSIAYQIFVDRFYRADIPQKKNDRRIESWGGLPDREAFYGGNLAGIREKLDYLQSLNIDLLYLTPIFLSTTNHRYDTVNYRQIDPMVGTNAEFAEFVKELHKRGMRIILDGVFNHTGDQFPAFLDAKEKGRQSAFWDWYLINEDPISVDPANYQTCGGCAYLPKLNILRPEVSQFVLDIATYWIREYDIDGWRLDCSFKIPYEFWRSFHQTVKACRSDAYLVGEVWREAKPWVDNQVFDGVTNYRLRELLIEFVVTNFLDAEDFGYELETLINSHGDAAASMLNLLDSHDTCRILTTCGGDIDKLRLLFALLMTLPGIPMIYYGDEIGLAGGNDPACRACMKWNKNDWSMLIYSWIEAMTSIRRCHSALQSGSFKKVYSFNGLIAFEREDKKEIVIILINSRKTEKNLSIPVRSQNWQNALTGEAVLVSDGKLAFTEFPANSCLIIFTTV